MKKNLIIVVGLLLVGLGAYFFLRGGYQTPSTSSPTSEVSQSNLITIKNLAFSPATSEIRVGESLTWRNEDNVPHQIADKPDGDLFKSGILEKGKTYSFTFEKAGEFDYFCTIHPSMTGKIIVR